MASEHNENSTNSAVFDLISAYALDALSNAERRQVESLLAESEDAREELRKYQEMLAGFAIANSTEYASVRRKSSRTLTADFQKRLAAEVLNSAETVRAAPTIAPSSKITTIQPRRLPFRLSWIATIAAVLVIALGLFGLSKVAQNQGETQIVQSILTNPSATHIIFTTPAGTQTKAEFVRVGSESRGVLVASLPPLPADRQYQLWMIHNTSPESALVFSPSSASPNLLVNMPDPNKEYDIIGITVEPLGGSKAPTSAPIYVAKIADG